MTENPPTPGAGRNCAVLGSPIDHSQSPTLHLAAYAALGLDWTYGRFDLTEPDLADFVNSRDESWRGLSLTMPLKGAVLELGEVDELAALAGAGNTLVFEADGTRRIYNTDVPGLVAAIRRVYAGPAARVTILGAGATARSSLVSAVQMGAREVTVVARTPAKAEPLRAIGEQLGVAVDLLAWASAVADGLPQVDLLMSTATAGAADTLATAAAASAPVIFDAIYHPWPTVLAATSEAHGCRVANGLDLLVGQGQVQVELMTGQRVSADVLYNALAASA